MTWYLPFEIFIAKTDVFAIECLDQMASDIEFPQYNWPHSLAVRAAVLNAKYHVITSATYSCHNPNPVTAKFKHVTNIETCTLLCCDHIISGCKHGGKRCSLLWQKRLNSCKTDVFAIECLDQTLSNAYNFIDLYRENCRFRDLARLEQI